MVLTQTSLTPQLKSAYTREILSFLHHCKTIRAAVTGERAKNYLIEREKRSSGPAREALRWFYFLWGQYPQSLYGEDHGR
jgi:hypothetical protein